MPITKSALKQLRQNKKHAQHNRFYKGKMKQGIKEFLRLAKEDKDKARQKLISLQSLIDKCVKKHILHANTASRKKSHLMKAL